MALLIDYIGTKLITSAAVTALVPGARISHGLRPARGSDALPAINYFQVAALPFDRATAFTYDVQISCRAEDLRTAQRIAEAVAFALVNTSETIAGVSAQSIEFGSEVTLPEPEIDAYHVALTLRFVVLSSKVAADDDLYSEHYADPVTGAYD